MKILITGHKGYIGSHLYEKLVELNHDVTGVDIKEGNDVLHCLPQEHFDCVFHMAALPRVGFSVENPSYTLKQNVLTTSVLLEWARENKIKRRVFSSSSAVTGNGDGPTSPYGAHKLMSEIECRLYSRLYGLDTVCLRYFNVYSEDQEYGGSYATVISSWMEMIRTNKELRMDGDGCQVRDFIHVSDVVSANIFCLNHDRGFSGKFYNIASGKSTSMNYIKEYIDKTNNVEWTFKPERTGDVKNSIADVREMTLLGWQPAINLEEGLKRCFPEKK